MADECKSCKAPVVWAKSVNDKAMIFDATPLDGGTGYVITNGIARYVSKADPSVKVYVSHWGSCKTAEQHRKAQT